MVPLAFVGFKEGKELNYGLLAISVLNTANSTCFEYFWQAMDLLKINYMKQSNKII